MNFMKKFKRDVDKRNYSLQAYKNKETSKEIANTGNSRDLKFQIFETKDT